MTKRTVVFALCLFAAGCTSEPYDSFDGKLTRDGQSILPKGKQNWGGGSFFGAEGANGDTLVAFNFSPSLWMAVVFGPDPNHDVELAHAPIRAVYLIETLSMRTDIEGKNWERSIRELAFIPDDRGALASNVYRMRGKFENVSKSVGMRFKYKIVMTSTPQPVYEINGARDRGERLEFHPLKWFAYGFFLVND